MRRLLAVLILLLPACGGGPQEPSYCDGFADGWQFIVQHNDPSIPDPTVSQLAVMHEECRNRLDT
jgi:hypothetical protein